MKYGVRQCANIVFRAKQETRIGTNTFHVGQPVLYIDTATTSSLEQASSTVYAQGGRGNPRLIAWEGDKTLTFTVTDALISPVSLSMLSGAGLVKTSNYVHVHATSAATMKYDETAGGTIDLSDALLDFGIDVKAEGADTNEKIDIGTDAPLFIMVTENDGSITGNLVTGSVSYTKGVLTISKPKLNGKDAITQEMNVLVDYYVNKKGTNISEIQITAEDFAGYYYVEADTLFRDQASGKDAPANLTFPNVKIQSNFTIAMSGTGDPSTFDFTMDAFPGYTYFDKSKKVLCVIQVVEDSAAATVEHTTVMPVNASIENTEIFKDSADSVPSGVSN